MNETSWLDYIGHCGLNLIFFSWWRKGKKKRKGLKKMILDCEESNIKFENGKKNGENNGNI